MKILSCVLVLLIAVSISYAQTKISGSVKDNKGRAVPSASVVLRDTYDGATSDSSGNYSFVTTEKGKHILAITAVGYKPA